MRFLQQMFVKGTTIFPRRYDVNSGNTEEVFRYSLLQYNQLFGELYAIERSEKEQIESEQYQIDGQPNNFIKGSD